MITFFTTCKNFTRTECNAINSWLALNNQTEIIVFTEEDKPANTMCPERVIYKPVVKKHASGLPLLNALFQAASELSKFNTLCYCNSDIILLPGFVERIQPILKLKSSYLAVSQRTDVEINNDTNLTNHDCVESLQQLINLKGELHPPLGSDIFIFPKFQYNEQSMPPLVVGRPHWDNWMLYDARKRFNKLIDFTGTDCVVVHQNHVEKFNMDSNSNHMNIQYLPKADQYTFILSYCNYIVENEKLKKSKIAVNDPRRLSWEIKFNKGNDIFSQLFARIRLSKWIIKSKAKSVLIKMKLLLPFYKNKQIKA